MCDLGLVYAASANEAKVDQEIIKELIHDGVILQAQPGPLFLTERVDPQKRAAE